jgi:hypothetical protein
MSVLLKRILMAIVRSFMMFGAVFMLAVSGGAYAKQNKNAGQGQSGGSEASEVNTNRQLRTGENVRGRDRAEERQGLQDTREPGSSSSEINSNKQMKTEADIRGADRAAERHELKDTKAPAKARKKTRAKVKKYPRASQ